MSVTVTDVCNLALQLLGAKRISAIEDSTPSARACALCYGPTRKSELRKYDWNFAITRDELAADSPAPDWGRANSFTLPADFLKLTNSYPEQFTNDAGAVGVSVAFTSGYAGQRDWVIEGNAIITNDAAPLQIRYIADITDTSLWDSIFVQVMAGAMAYVMAEELTQSNSKKAEAAAFYKHQITEGKKQGSIEIAPADPPPDIWISVRN